MLSDPQSVTYNGVTTSLARKSAWERSSRYVSSDGLIELRFDSILAGKGGDSELHIVKLSRISPDPTPSDVFDPYRPVINSVSMGFGVDETQYDATVHIPYLRAALDSFLTVPVVGRVLGGER